jgi:hypothetical protein
MSTGPRRAASSSVSPTVASGGTEKTAVGDRPGRQVEPVGHVADGIDVRDIGAVAAIDGHGAALVQRHARGREVEAAQIGLPAGGEDDEIHRDVASVGEMHAPLSALGEDLRRGDAVMQVDTVVPHGLGECLPQVGIEAAQR